MSGSCFCHTCGHDSEVASERCPKCSSINWASQKTLRAKKLAPRLRCKAKEMIGDREERKLRSPTLHFCRESANALLEQHKLRVPDATVEMIARTIHKSTLLGSKRLKKGTSATTPTDRLRRAGQAASRLLKYTNGRVSHADSIAIQCKKLQSALCDLSMPVWIPVSVTDIPAMLEKLTVVQGARGLHQQQQALCTVANEIKALVDFIAGMGAASRPGRPKDWPRIVVQGGLVAWRRSGRDADFDKMKGTTGQRERARGEAFGKFVRGLLTICGITLREEALRTAVSDARAYLKPVLSKISVE